MAADLVSKRKSWTKKAKRHFPGAKIEWRDGRLHANGQPIVRLGLMGPEVPVLAHASKHREGEHQAPRWPGRYHKPAPVAQPRTPRFTGFSPFYR